MKKLPLILLILFSSCSALHVYDSTGKEYHDVCSEKGRYKRISGRWIYKGACVMDSSKAVTFIWSK